MTRKQQYIILALVAVLALSGGVACVCCPTGLGTDVTETPVVQRPTEAPAAPTKPAALPTEPPVAPTEPPVAPTEPPEQPTAVPLGSTQIKSLRFMLDVTTGDGETMKVEAALSPTAMYLKMTEVKADGTKEEQELYYVDGYMYVKDETGNWQKLPGGQMPANILEGFDFNKVLKEAQDEGELELKPVGTEMVRGVLCVKYEFIIKDPSEQGKGFAYVGLTDGLVYRLEGESTDDEGVTTKIVFECWDYNEDIVITPPI